MRRYLLVAFEVDEDSTIGDDELWVMGDQIATDMTEAGPLTYEGSHVVVGDQGESAYATIRGLRRGDQP